jgi:hypothetical protein
MKARRSLHIPLFLTWTALSGAAVVASVACGSSSEEAEQDASHPPRDGAPLTDRTTMEASRTDSSSMMEASNSDVSDVTHPECVATVDGSLVYYQAEGSTCPHPECERITDSSIIYFEADGSNCPDGDPQVPIV